MPLLSLEFAGFFLLFLPLYWSVARWVKLQNILLLVTSMGWLYRLNPWFAVTILSYALCIFVLTHLMHITANSWRKRWCGIGIILSLLTLSVFKYFDFFRPYIQQAWGSNDFIDLIMPLGLSYYTFQSISYLIYVYRQPHSSRMAWYDLLLFLSFFPTITSGPIIRADSFKSIMGEQQGAIAQIMTKQPRQILRPALAISLILLGIAKKWWLAGVLSEGWVEPVFANPSQLDAWAVLTGIYGYTFQLFFDFSGYCDLVIGLALLLGFQLPQNFAAPLRAWNLRDFWDRWHISLSTWIRDYIYIPLGGSHHGWWRTQCNLLIALVLSGLWHGYGWNFFLWGLLHGLALVFLNIIDKINHTNPKRALFSQHPIGKWLSLIITLHFVCATFVIFHAQNLNEAHAVFNALLSQSWNTYQINNLILLVLFALMIIIYPYLQKWFDDGVNSLEKKPIWLWCIPIVLIMLLLVIVAPSGIPNFIYANF